MSRASVAAAFALTLAVGGAAGAAGTGDAVANDAQPDSTTAGPVFQSWAEVLPPDDSEPPATLGDQGTADLERQLAEWSFASFLAAELGIEPDSYTCSEPSSLTVGSPVTCFAISGTRVVIATTTVSGSSGLFEFVVIADYPIGGDSPGTGVPPSAPTTAPAAAPTTGPAAPRPTDGPGVAPYPPDEVAEANNAVLLYGDTLNAIAEYEMAAAVNAAEGTIAAYNAWVWDPAAATFTVDITLNEPLASIPDAAAWSSAMVLGAHWARGRPFREPAATIRASLVLVMSGHRYVADLDLMVQVADQVITSEGWLSAARQS